MIDVGTIGEQYIGNGSMVFVEAVHLKGDFRQRSVMAVFMAITLLLVPFKNKVSRTAAWCRGGRRLEKALYSVNQETQ